MVDFDIAKRSGCLFFTSFGLIAIFHSPPFVGVAGQKCFVRWIGEVLAANHGGEKELDGDCRHNLGRIVLCDDLLLLDLRQDLVGKEQKLLDDLRARELFKLLDVLEAEFGRTERLFDDLENVDANGLDYMLRGMNVVIRHRDPSRGRIQMVLQELCACVMIGPIHRLLEPFEVQKGSEVGDLGRVTTFVHLG